MDLHSNFLKINYKNLKKIFLFKLFFLNINFSGNSIEIINISDADYGCLSEEFKTLFIPISQGQQRLYLEYHNPLNTDDNCEKCKWQCDFKASYLFQETLNSCDIAKILFQNNPLNFYGGAQENLGFEIPLDTNRPKNALIPEYFGLSDNVKTSLFLSPKIKNSIIELQFSFNLDNLWFQVVAPITFSNWQINNGEIPFNKIDSEPLDNEQVATGFQLYNVDPSTPYSYPTIDPKTQTTVYTPYNGINEINSALNTELEIEDYFTAENPQVNIGFWQTPFYSNNSGVEVPINLLSSNTADNRFASTSNTLGKITQSLVDSASSLTEALGGYTFGDLKNRNFNLFNFSNNSFNNKVGISDLQLWLGWDFIHKDRFDLGMYIRATAPCGSKLNQDWLKYIFSPVIGNGGHIGLGLGLTSNLYLFLCDNEDFTIHFDGYLMHLFSNNQVRSFDQKNNPMSRYAIVKELKYNGSNNTGQDNFSYNGLSVLGDINYGSLDINIPFSGELVFDLIYRYKSCSGGLGYSLIGQTKEKSACIKECDYNGIYNLVENKTNNLKNSNIYYGYKSIACLSSLSILAADKVFSSPNDPFYPTDATFFAKTDDNITIGGNSGSYSYGTLTGVSINDNLPSIPTENDVFILPDFNRSGLMEAQILNKIFGHIEFFWPDYSYCPGLKLLAAYGFSTNSYKTANIIEMGLQFSANF